MQSYGDLEREYARFDEDQEDEVVVERVIRQGYIDVDSVLYPNGLSPAQCEALYGPEEDYKR